MEGDGRNEDMSKFFGACAGAPACRFSLLDRIFDSRGRTPRGRFQERRRRDPLALICCDSVGRQRNKRSTRSDCPIVVSLFEALVRYFTCIPTDWLENLRRARLVRESFRDRPQVRAEELNWKSTHSHSRPFPPSQHAQPFFLSLHHSILQAL